MTDSERMDAIRQHLDRLLARKDLTCAELADAAHVLLIVSDLGASLAEAETAARRASSPRRVRLLPV